MGNNIKWISFDEQEAPNINPIRNNKRVICAKIRECELEDGGTFRLIDWVQICYGRGIGNTFNKNSASLSSHGIRSIWGGTCCFDLEQATHWAVIELPVTNEELEH